MSWRSKADSMTDRPAVQVAVSLHEPLTVDVRISKYISKPIDYILQVRSIEADEVDIRFPLIVFATPQGEAGIE